MRFTLTYTGRLPSSSNAKIKHEIRQALHPQLDKLWATHPALEGSNHLVMRDPTSDEVEQGRLLTNVGGHDFAALVHPYMRLYTELDILVLRPEAPGAVISHSGDLDNQLKTLFDALRRPTDVSEVPKAWAPLDGQDPLHCLLDDDKLITSVRVETDRLLQETDNVSHVQLIIRVAVKGYTATWGNLGMIA